MTDCTNCGKAVEVIHEYIYPNGERKPTQIVGGAAWNLGGGYNEFNDTVFVGEVVLCHDCVLAVFRVLPGVVKEFGGGTRSPYEGWHPYNGDKPCCEFGWTLDESDNRSHGWNDHSP